MSKIKIGFLPLYLELYDQVCPERRGKMEGFAAQIADELGKSGIEVAAAPLCRLKPEFARAIEMFEDRQVDAIVSMHLAYSPSLESIDAVSATELPLIILDTTPDFDFGFTAKADMIMGNHGIHGVQDFCNMLIRRKKKFMLEVGHWQHSDVLERVIDDVKACAAARAMKTARVGIIGEPFAGMGDFALPFADLGKIIGLKVIQTNPEELASLRPNAGKTVEEAVSWRKTFIADDVSNEGLSRTAETSLTVREWIEQRKLTALSFNFLDVERYQLPTVPFLEVSMAMARGIGYAGEGDVLTAALSGALAQVYEETTFAEMFCPDWAGGRIFMSHMGELSINVIDGKPALLEKDFPFFSVPAPVLCPGRMKPGSALLFDLAPGPDNTFTLIAAPVEVCADAAEEDTLKNCIRGWIKPIVPIADFLKQYSLHGGTHHLVLSYGASPAFAEAFAAAMNWNLKIIE